MLSYCTTALALAVAGPNYTTKPINAKVARSHTRKFNEMKPKNRRKYRQVEKDFDKLVKKRVGKRKGRITVKDVGSVMLEFLNKAQDGSLGHTVKLVWNALQSRARRLTGVSGRCSRGFDVSEDIETILASGRGGLAVRGACSLGLPPLYIPLVIHDLYRIIRAITVCDGKE